MVLLKRIRIMLLQISLKPEKFVSDLANVGIYFFKDGLKLNAELQYLIDNNITEKGEFQLTDALENMKQKGAEFYPEKLTNGLIVNR